ncbi:glycosyltransferase [Winogradskyella sp. 3972H.M.0a.05]|uniref:glycosyltransferase family 4 protein n=1 Tax=Winogradskyella sp. 3972H.M.0a.05 TaxID=2950277 RepID=UPI00339B77ED
MKRGELKIGIVLSKTPAYSETFFVQKIIGLKAVGITPVLFVQSNRKAFSECEVKVAPKVNKRFRFMNPIRVALVFLKFALFYSGRLRRFLRFEKAVGRSFSQAVKNFYNNSHILQSKVDWVHFGFTTLAINSENVAKTINAKMALSLRGFDIDVYPLKHKDPYRLVWQSVDKVHAISDYVLQKAYQNGLSEQTDFNIIYPALEPSKFKLKNAAQEELTFLTVARLHWIKGLNYTLEALAMLKREGLQFKYTIVGKGELYESLKFAINQLGLEGDVKLVGEKSHSEILGYYRTNQFYIQYSLSEGFCNSVLEAQASGLVCIVSDVGGLVENIINGETGFTVEPYNSKILAEAIRTVINMDYEKLNAIKDNAVKRVEEKFNLSLQAEKSKAFYE